MFDRGDKSGFLRPNRMELDELEHQPKHSSGKAVPSGLWVDLGAYGVPRLIKQGKSWVRCVAVWCKMCGCVV